MNKRPLFAAAIGFVLGEVCAWLAESGEEKNAGRMGTAGTEKICLLVLVLVCVGLGWLIFGKKRKSRKKQRYAQEIRIVDASAFLCFFSGLRADERGN